MNKMIKFLIIIVLVPILILSLWLCFIWYAATRPYDHRTNIEQTKEMIPDAKQFFFDNEMIFYEVINNEPFDYDIEKYNNLSLNNIKIKRVAQNFGIEFALGGYNFTTLFIYYKPDFIKLPRVAYKEKINEDWHIVIRTYEPG